MPLSPEAPPPVADLASLLNQAVLRLSPDVQVAELPADRVAVKYVPGRRYLVLTPAQLALLQRFGTGRTVPQVLCAAITAQRCPSLRDFYELVVKAVRAGLLQTEAVSPPPPEPPARWPLRVNGTFLRWLTLLLGVGAAAALLWRRVQLMPDPAWLVLGWLLACAAVSLGWLLAAGVVRAAGREVHHPRFVWKTPAPRFVADLDDVLMSGRAVRINAALARLAPMLLVTALAAWRVPELLGPLLAGILLLLSPLWRSPLQEILAALYRDPQLATSYDLVLVRDRLFALLGRTRRQMADGKFLLACAVATVAWLLVVFLGGCVLLQTNATELWQRFNAVGGARYTALALLVGAGLIVAGSLGLVVWSLLRHVRAWARERRERRLRPATVLVSPETIAEWLGRTVLFRDLAAADLAAVAAAVKPELHKRGSFVVKEGEPGEKLYVVLSGRLQVRRDYAPGRSEPVAEMGDGGVFGEIALVRGGRRTRSVRALEKSVLLGLDKADFERLVLTKMSRAAVEDAVQKVGFLEQIELARNWSHATLTAFARRAVLHEFTEGKIVVQQGTNNHWFFLVHRGELAVIKNNEELRRLKQGDSFGEMSLLGDGIATATVKVCSPEARCLAISGTDFLDFVTKDFAIGLGWDDVRIRPAKRQGMAGR
jgi:CRP-like cAMP-binding protein